MIKNIRSFSIMEIMIVLILVGLLVAFALPNYGRSSVKTDERIIISNLMAARAATRMYMANSGGNIPNFVDTDEVNAGFGLEILDQKATYSCATNNSCQATHQGGWTIHYHYGGGHLPGGELHCTGGTCPTCPNQPGNCGE